MGHVLHPLGRISKTHGYNGSVVLVSDQPFNDELEQLEELFILIDGLQVPFPVEEFTLLTDTSAHVRLEFVDNQNEAIRLVNCEVYAVITFREQKMVTELEQWIDFAVHDTNYGKIGVIQNIEDYKGNIVMQVMDGDKEILISLYTELITNIDHHAKILYITAPDGYF